MFDVTSIDVEHAAQLEELHAQAFSPGWSVSEFITHIENDMDDVLGIWAETQLVGFIVTRTQIDQSEILTIVVAAVHQGKGLGKNLLMAGEQVARTRGATIMFLDVAADNLSAQALYQNYGYHRCGTRKSYYRRAKGRVDALLFQKKL